MVRFFFILVLAANFYPVAAEGEPAERIGPAEPAELTERAGPAELPTSYRGLHLGMGLEEAQDALLADGLFGYRGERDLSLLPGDSRTLIETAGPSFIRRSWFQFHEGTLWSMIFTLDPGRIDYYSIYTTLVAKYGEPHSLNPSRARWADDRVILTLERPLTIKYLDAVVFETLLAESFAGRAASDILREEFLEDF